MVDSRRVEITPEPSETERKAILAALALENADAERRSGNSAAPEQPWGDPGVVEP
jgi:hypothetical protein